MYLLKGPVVWRSLHQLTRHTPDLPLWTSLSEYPLKQLTAPARVIPRVFYLPQSIAAMPAAAAPIQHRRAA